MFDGDFRARKEVNLSGGRRRRRGDTTTTKNKESILKNAEAQRKQRQEHQRRSKAARLLQKWTRGHLTRLHLVTNEWLPLASQNLAATSRCLIYRNWFTHHKKLASTTSIKQVLLKLIRHSLTTATLNDDDDDDNMDVSQHGEENFYQDSIWYSKKRLFRVTLQEFIPSNLTNPEESQALLSLLQSYWPLCLEKMDEQLFLDLTSCLSQWIRERTNDTTKGLLCQWAMQASQNLSNPQTQALLATIVLGSADTADFASSLPGDTYTLWILPLVDALEDTTNNEKVNPIQQATRDHLRNGYDRRILSNLLHDSTILTVPQPRALVQLIHHVLMNNSTGDLALLAQLLVKGENIQTAAPSGNTTDQELDDSEQDDPDDDEEDEEMEDASSSTSKQNATQSPRVRSSAARYTRKDLLTIPKLDRVYQDEFVQQKRNCAALSNGTVTSSANAQSTLRLAKTLVQAPWLQWGHQLLQDPQNPGARYFVESLAALMQAMTSLRPTTKVGILSPLAFNRPFLLQLWTYATKDGNIHELGLTIFCDLFAHYLVALSDVDFLRFHTTVETSLTTNSSIRGTLAVDIIEQLRSTLHELFWSKPVLANEVAAMEPRGRLLLAGTKVWNSLYERWNRLVRNNSFCEESSWWFPHMSSKGRDAAVVPVRERQSLASSRSSDDDDMMQIDGRQNGNDDEDEDSSSDEEDAQPMSAVEAETDALADAFRDPKMARVLTCIPQALPFDRRVKLFHSLLKADKFKVMTAAASRRLMMASGGENDEIMFDGSVRERVTIRRAKLYSDSMQQLNELGTKLKHRVQVSFVNQHGAEEAGIDGGGVFKEFLDDLIKDGFAAKAGGQSQAGAPPLFSVTPLQTLAVNFDIADDPQMLVHYEFLGRVLGKAVYESILVEPQFCLPFLNQLLGKINSMEDLKNYDEEYYSNLNKLKLLNDADIEPLGLSFELTVGGKTSAGTPGQPRTVELMRGGHSIPVRTKAHVFQYMHAVSNQLLNIQGVRQTKAFLRGFRDLIPASWVRLFSANELQKLISGDDSVRGIDVASLQKAMSYLGGYHPSQPYIQDFWDIVEKDLTPEQQQKLLRFMTSCSRQPLLGFSSLEPSPSIQQIRLSDAELSKNSKLPTSQTCMNLLKLPNYKDRALLKEKLIAAIESGAGFELT